MATCTQIEVPPSPNITFTLQDSDQEKSSIVLRSSLQQPEIQDKALQEIRRLNKTVDSIKDLFNAVSHNLHDFDNQNFPGPDGNPIKLAPKWRQCRVKYNEVLDDSRRDANDAAVIMNSYNNVLLKNAGPSNYEALEKELAGYLKIVEGKAAKASETRKKFSDIVLDISYFEDSVNDALKTDGVISDTLRSAQENLKSLREEFKELKNEMRSVGAACLASLSAGVGSVGLAVLTLSPIAMTMALGSVVAAVGTGTEFAMKGKRAYNIKKKIKHLNAEVSRLNVQQESFASYKKNLTEAVGDIHGLQDKIEVLSNIWQHIQMDMSALQTNLQVVLGDQQQDSKMLVTDFFPPKLEVTHALNVKLITLLEEYAKETIDGDVMSDEEND